MDLVFEPLEVAAVAAAAGICALVSLDGESNWLEGALLMGVYAILGVSFFYLGGAIVAGVARRMRVARDAQAMRGLRCVSRGPDRAALPVARAAGG